jgi:bifunctional ADP-heptose synthase (sugar kinase/adenylyltransferase)
MAKEERELLEEIADSSKGVSLKTAIAGEDLTNDVMKVEMRNSNTYISTATTTTVKTGVGLLHSIVLGETAAGAITIYDNTAASGTVIGVLKASIVEGTYIFNTSFSVGLTIVTAGASKLTVNYR